MERGWDLIRFYFFPLLFGCVDIIQKISYISCFSTDDNLHIDVFISILIVCMIISLSCLFEINQNQIIY